MPGRQRSVSDVRSHEKPRSVGAGEPPAVAGDRSNDDGPAIGAVEQTVKTNASPPVPRTNRPCSRASRA